MAWTQVKLILLTAVLTGLIWVFADQADRREATCMVQLRLVPHPDSNLVAEMLDPETGRLSVRVRGTNRALQNLGAFGSEGLIVVDWRLRADFPVGRSTHPLQRILADSTAFAGVVVTDTYPAQATINVDRYMVTELPIRLQEGAFALAGQPQIDPPSASVRILESAWKELPVDARWLQLSLGNYLKSQPEGRLLSFEAALPTQLAGHSVLVEPASVQVSLTLQERTSERRIAPVVVKFAVASELWGAYRPELKDPSQERLGIEVVGTEDALAQLTAQDVLGIIDVTSDDVAPEGEFRFKRPVFILPPGIRLKGQAPQVEFILRPVRK